MNGEYINYFLFASIRILFLNISLTFYAEAS